MHSLSCCDRTFVVVHAFGMDALMLAHAHHLALKCSNATLCSVTPHKSMVQQVITH